MKPFIIRLLRAVQMDRAVFFGILNKAWAFLSGPISLLLIAHFFTPSTQGYYYTFSSLLALQVFLELGLAQVIIQFASHEWARLSLDQSGNIVGDSIALSRLVSLGRSVFRWYFLAGFIFMVGLNVGGVIFFSHSAHEAISWKGPWIGLSIFAGLNMILIPVLALLEGCNQMASLNMFRFVQGALGSIVIWTAIYLGANLWTSVFFMATNVCATLVFIGCRYRRFFGYFMTYPAHALIPWRGEIWPLQWRIALSWLAGYFSFYLFTPILFNYQGAVVAGQMGMTWNMLSAVSSLAYLWVAVRAPSFGILISRREFKALDHQFWRSSVISISVAFFGCVCVWLLTFFLFRIHHSLAKRCLPLLPTALFCLGTAILQIAGCLSFYLRAHKREPFLVLSLLQGTLTALCTIFLGRHFGVTGIASGYLGVITLILPLSIFIWYRCRENWHVEIEQTSELSQPTSLTGF